MGNAMPQRKTPTTRSNDDGRDPAMVALGNAVRQRRADLRLTQHDLANRSGVSVATVKKLEAGTEPGFRDLTLSGIERALGWPTGAASAYLAGETPELPEPTARPTIDLAAGYTDDEADYLAAALRGLALPPSDRALVVTLIRHLLAQHDQ